MTHPNHLLSHTLEGCTLEKDSNLRLWSLDNRMSIAKLRQLFENLANPSCPLNGEILKKARQRLVCRIPTGQTNQTIICKLFPLSSPLSWPRWRKFAFREFRNMRVAKILGCPAPEPLAFINYRRHGMVHCTGVLMEDLKEWRDLRTVAEQEGPLAAAKLAGSAFQSMAKLGCLHEDARDENILVSNDQSKWSIIDWQYARFCSPHLAQQTLAKLVSYYIKKSPVSYRSTLEKDWIPEITESQPDLEFRIQSYLLNQKTSRFIPTKNKPSANH